MIVSVRVGGQLDRKVMLRADGGDPPGAGPRRADGLRAGAESGRDVVRQRRSRWAASTTTSRVCPTGSEVQAVPSRGQHGRALATMAVRSLMQDTPTQRRRWRRQMKMNISQFSSPSGRSPGRR
jgi:hypothetical protein